MWRNKYKTKNKIKSRHVHIDDALYISIQLTNNAMVSLKDSFTVWRQRQKEDFLSIICQHLAQYDVCSWRKSNFL